MLSSKRVVWEVCVELACDVSLEASDGFGFGFAFGAAALEVSRPIEMRWGHD